MGSSANPTNLNLGFNFMDPPDPGAPGYHRLEIILRDAPTEKHFDPEEVQINLSTAKQESIQMTHIYHPWGHPGRYQAVAGRILIEDRHGMQVEAFTFGGEFSIDLQETHTNCHLESPAIILHPTQPNSIPWLLARLGQQFLAERSAAHLPDLEIYERKLIQADPLILYAVFLQSNEKRFENFPYPHETSIHNIHYALQAEIERMQDRKIWPQHLPSIQELL